MHLSIDTVGEEPTLDLKETEDDLEVVDDLEFRLAFSGDHILWRMDKETALELHKKLSVILGFEDAESGE